MTPEKTNALLTNYPKIFRNGFQFECDDGWYQLISDLCKYIQGMIDNNDHLELQQVKAVQVKEKFGTLRFYIEYFESVKGNKRQEEWWSKVYGAIHFAEFISRRFCERCGINQNVKMRSLTGRYHIYCDSCEEQYMREQDA